MISFKLLDKDARFDIKELKLVIEDEDILFDKPTPIPKKEVYFKLNNYCNLKCTYCYQVDESVSQMDNINDIDIYNGVLKRIFDNGDIFHLFGGEPFLDINYSKIEKVLSFASSEKKINAFSNGCFSEKYINLLKCNVNKIGYITITLDGNRAAHNSRRIAKNGEGSFDTIISNIEELVKCGINVVIQINIDQDNINGIGELLLFIENNSILSSCKVLLNRVLHTTNGISEMDLLKLYVKHSQNSSFEIMLNSVIVKALTHIITGDEGMIFGRCNAGNTFVFDFSCGYIYTCPESSKTICGSFTEEGIIINQAFLDEVTQYTQKNTPSCKSCEYNLFCGKGCYIEQDLNSQKCENEVHNSLQYIFDNFEVFFDVEC